MEDVSISKFRAQVVRAGSTPASPGFVVSEGQNPVDPSGSGQNHLPVTIATAATGLSITESQVLGGAGTVGQYIRGDGSLADFPATTGGGSSVSYYLNGSVSQGTIGGVAYKELNRTPIFGAGTDISISADGYIASFITDALDPNKLLIPAGNWNFETYFSASSSGGSPSFYIELYKYNGTTFTLIATSSAAPELIAFGTNLNPYFSTLAVPETVLALTDRLALRYYVTHSGRTITLHTENGHLCEVITTFTTGLTALNGLTNQVQFFAVGTSGTDFAISSASDTHTFNLPTASATNRGVLSSADWTTFNNKQNALTNPVTGTGTTNYLTKFTGSTSIGNSIVYDDGAVGIGTLSATAINNASGIANLVVGNGGASPQGITIYTNSSTYGGLNFADATTGGGAYAGYIKFDHANDSMGFFIGNNPRVTIFSDGNTFIGSSPSNAGFKLDVNGTGRFSGQLTSGSTTAGFINAKSFLIGTDGTETNYRYQFYLSSNDLKLYSRGYGDFLTINYSTGAATFASSVALGQTISVVATNGILYHSTNNNLYIQGGSDGLAMYSDGGRSNSSIVLDSATKAVYLGTNSVTRLSITSTGFVSAGAITNGRLGVRGFTNDSSGYAFESANASGNTLFIVRNDGATSVSGKLLVNTFTPGSSPLRLVSLPTSAVGLSSGDVYNLGGTLMIA